MCVCERVALCVQLGPSTYSSFPIPPSLSPYRPTRPPSLRHSYGSEFRWRSSTWCRSSGLPLPLLPLPKQVRCAVRRRAAKRNELVDMVQCIRSFPLPMYLIRPSLQLPKFPTGLRSVAAQKIPLFSAKTPEPPRPSPVVGVREPNALPALNCWKRRVTV